MAAWEVLYTLARLARYQPRQWAQLTDVDNSSAAEAIANYLDEFIRIFPELAADAIDKAVACANAEARTDAQSP
ncbi:MAG: hypothetical protein LCH98_19180 [Actinobacteria bacterium]|nr:hypothetical protein [Actinomycetota bacterium]